MDKIEKQRLIHRWKWRLAGWAIVLALLTMGVCRLYPFLCRTQPLVSPVMVLESWMSDADLEQALAWAATNGVERIYLTGLDINIGSWLSEWKTYPDMTMARLAALEANRKYRIFTAPGGNPKRNRTVASAWALKDRYATDLLSFNVVSVGPHTRRSWRVFERVMGEEIMIGSVALTPAYYNQSDWWKSSEGVRSMIGELIAYLYDVVRRDSSRPADDLAG